MVFYLHLKVKLAYFGTTNNVTDNYNTFGHRRHIRFSAKALYP